MCNQLVHFGHPWFKPEPELFSSQVDTAGVVSHWILLVIFSTGTHWVNFLLLLFTVRLFLWLVYWEEGWKIRESRQSGLTQWPSTSSHPTCFVSVTWRCKKATVLLILHLLCLWRILLSSSLSQRFWINLNSSSLKLYLQTLAWILAKSYII